MKSHKVLFTADLHGNEGQYERLVRHALKISADSVIIGGDIAPKNLPSDTFIAGQRLFLRERLPELLRPLKARVFLMMGNDDCAANLDVLEQGDPEFYRIIHGKRIALTEYFDLVGYCYVPITPFGIKDWEKHDFSRVPESLREAYHQRKLSNCRLAGFKSTQQGWSKFLFTPEMEQEDSIQRDLEQDIYRKNPQKTVYAVHTPPDRTKLDQTSAGHVGSMAVRAFIEKEQPYLTLHGHVHETVEVSGSFTDTIGKTLCAAPGNHHAGIAGIAGLGSPLAALEFDLYKPNEMKRRIIG